MKNIICLMLIFNIMLAVTQITGCGRNENEPDKGLSEPEASQTLIEEDEDLFAEDEITESAETGSSMDVGIQDSDRDISPGLSSQGRSTVSETLEIPDRTEAAPSIQEIPDVIIIDNQVYSSDKKGPVKFSHIKHNKEYDAACVQCHHIYKDGENIWKEGGHVDKCVVCHDPVEEKDKLMKLQNAFHKNCKDCHSEVNKEGKEAPNTKCTGCHES